MRGHDLGFVAFCAVLIGLALYFAITAIRGDYGVVERVIVEAEIDALEARREVVAGEVDALENKTRRLSDDYLDLELLDERARDVLGLMRRDELILR